MLTFLGFAMVVTFMYLIMSKRLSALIALILVPIAFALFGGFAAGIGPMMLEGITKLAPTGVMLMFAILYFALMIDSGLFDPAVRLILRLVKGDPVKVSVGTAVLALVVSLDGDGATTYMICVAAMLPLYARVGMSPRIMAGLIILAGGVMNMTPWGGPTARAASALHVDPSDIFVPMIPAMLVGVLAILLIAYAYGKRERARLGELHLSDDDVDHSEISVSQFPASMPAPPSPTPLPPCSSLRPPRSSNSRPPRRAAPTWTPCTTCAWPHAGCARPCGCLHRSIRRTSSSSGTAACAA